MKVGWEITQRTECEGGVGRNAFELLLAVGKTGRDGENALTTDLHTSDTLIPSLDDLTLSEPKVEGLALDVLVEDVSVVELSNVAHTYTGTLLSLGAIADLGILNLETTREFLHSGGLVFLLLFFLLLLLGGCGGCLSIFGLQLLVFLLLSLLGLLCGGVGFTAALGGFGGFLLDLLEAAASDQLLEKFRITARTHLELLSSSSASRSSGFISTSELTSSRS